MNLENNPTIEQLRELVRQCDDRAGHHVVWVSKAGDVQISMVLEDQSPVEFESARPEMQLRLETFQRGNEYVGPDAAVDEEWISELFENLKNAWRETKGKQEVAYIDVIGS